MKKHTQGIWRLFGKGVSMLFYAVLILLLVLQILFFQPEQNVHARDLPPQALLPSSGMQSAEDDAGMIALSESYPVPVLMMAGTKLTSATSYDVPFENGYARLFDAVYQVNDNFSVTCRTIYPSRAQSLVERQDYHLTSSTFTLAEKTAVTMQNETMLRLHVQTDQAIYVLLLPRVDTDTMSQLLRRTLVYSKP